MRGQNRTIGGGGTGEMELVVHDSLWRVDLDQPLTSAARVTGVIEGRARAEGWAAVELDGALHLTCTDLGRCQEALAPAASPADTDLLTGSLVAEVRVNGTLGRPRLTGSVAVADVGVGALSGIQLEANVSADLTTLDVASAVGRLGNNVIRGRVRVVWDGGLIDGAIDGELRDLERLTPMLPAEWAPRGTVRVDAAIAGSASSPSFDRITLTGNQLVLTPLFAGTPDEIPIAGRVNLEFEGSGPVAAPVGTATLEATDLAWNDYRLGTARATIEVDGGTVHGQAELPEFSAVAEIALDLADRRTVDLIVDVADADLARVAADTAVPLAGTASLGAHVTYAFGESGGSAAAERVTVDIQLRSIEGSVGATPVRLVQPADLRYLPTDISTDHVELTVGGTRVTLSGRLADGRADILTARALGRVQDLTPLLAQIPGVAEWTGELDLAGTFQLEVVVAGSPSAPLLSGDLSLDNGRVGFGDHPPVDPVTLQAVYRDGAVRLEQLSGSWQRASLFATGVLPASLFADHLPPLIADVLPAGGPATLRAEINGITPAALVGYVAESTRMQLEGEMRATVDIQADDARLDAIRGALTLPEAAVTIAGIPLAQRRETRVELADGRVRIATFDWGNDDDYVTLGGTVSVGDDAVADLTVTAEIDLRALSAFLPATVEGNALLIANIAGPIATPEITGTLELTDTGIRIADPRVAITNLSGALFLNDGVVVIHDMSGAANGGGLVVGGVLQLEGFRPHGTVTLAGRRIAMDVPTGLRTEVDADLGLTFEVDDIVLAGTATIQRGAYRKPITLAGGVLGALERSQSVRTVGLGQTGALDAVQLDLRITTTEDIRLDNNYLDAALGADVRVGGTIGAPALTGRIALAEGGRIRFGSRAYEIEAGSVDLVDPTGVDPRLDIRARTRASGYDMTLSVSGGPGEFVTSLESNPPLPESDIVSVLLTGQTPSESDAGASVGARNQALGLVSTELLGSAGRDLGLDIRVGEEMGGGGQTRFDSILVAGDLDPTTRLTVGKRLNDQVTLIASQNLRDSELAWIVDYLPRNNIELRGLFGGENDRAYEFRHALELGAPPPRGDPSALDQRLAGQLRVASVEFFGEPGPPVETLGTVTRLRPGNRFDFYRWQDDQDRLERFYRDRGYREVRLRSRRLELPEGVALEYTIARGPLTRLVIEGHVLPSSLRRSMEQAWEDSVLDAFLLDELRTLVQGYLSEEGFLEAHIEAIVASSVDPSSQKTIAVTIAAGPRTRRREVVFQGNEGLDSGTVRAFITARGLDPVAWSEPERIEAALAELYRSRGWLEAGVVAGRPVFESTEARLPIEIDEGRLFAIESVRLSGVSSRPEHAARDTLGLTPGEPYREGEVQAGRAALERSYRSEGFNAARVAARSTIDTAAGTVVVDISVSEGLQQIIQDVVVEGAARSHPTLVANALRFTPGDVVDLSEWNLARARLYDTGVFRLVDIQAVPVEPSAASVYEPVRAKVVLEERPAYSLRYGVAVSDRDAPPESGSARDVGLAFAGDFSRRNLLGRAATVGVSVRAALDRETFRGYFSIPRFFGAPITTNIYAENRRETLGEENAEFVTDLRTLTFEQRVRRPGSLSFVYSANFERNRTFDKDPDPDFPFDLTLNLLRVNGSALIDKRDNLFDARRGWFHASTIEYGFEPGKGTVELAKYFGQQYHYWPVGPIVLASAGRVGLATGLGSDLIPSEHFFAGGGNTVRGYPQDSLGPRNILGGVAGGNALVVLNQELRFPVFWRLSGVGFIDAGNVFETVKRISLSDLAVGAGLGLRLDTPVGLLRFDYGFALRRSLLVSQPGEHDPPIGQFFFSIGQAF